MKIRVLGCGFYGAHIGLSLIEAGHHVEIHEIGRRIFCGASGSIPARLHAGALHYPRSHATRKACLAHRDQFLDRYGFLTRAVPINIYAIAQNISLIDFETYREVLRQDIEFITIYDPTEFGLRDVEGAVLCGERHINTNHARDFFEAKLLSHTRLNMPTGVPADDRFDMTVDCTFAANSSANVSRYEPCLVLLMRGPTDKAITLMDFPDGCSLYPWNEEMGLCSLSSARWTPFSKECRTYEEARALLDSLSQADIDKQSECMIASMRHYYPAIDEFEVADFRLSIRAMPLSAADTRLVEVARDDDKLIRVRAGKIDAVIQAEKLVRSMIE